MAFKPGASEGYIIDPTIWFDLHIGQAEEADAEKKMYLRTDYPVL